MNNIILIITATSAALVAGLMYAYTCSVNIGLGRLADREYLSAMQAINRAILNPLFFISYIGTLILLPLSTWLQYGHPLPPPFLYLFLAFLVYLIGVFGVTMFGNVPLNEILDHFNLQTATTEEIVNQRIKFEKPWLMFHNIRTISSIISLILVLISCTRSNA